MREVFNAIRYVNRTGCQWRRLPKELDAPQSRPNCNSRRPYSRAMLAQTAKLEKPMTLKKLVCGGAIVALALAITPTNARAQRGGHPGSGLGGPLFNTIAALGGKVVETNLQAMHVFRALPRLGSCEERRNHWLAILPDALQYARYARDIYDKGSEMEMQKAGETSRQLGEDRFAYFDTAGQRYAEVRLDKEHGRIVVIFRGTRLDVASDVTTSVLNFVGLETGYYEWAAHWQPGSRASILASRSSLPVTRSAEAWRCMLR